MDTDFVEFRQLQEVGIFPTCVILWLRVMYMVEDVLRLGLVVFFCLKTFEPSGENPHCCGREQCQPDGFAVHVNSDVIFCVNFYVVE